MLRPIVKKCHHWVSKLLVAGKQSLSPLSVLPHMVLKLASATCAPLFVPVDSLGQAPCCCLLTVPDSWWMLRQLGSESGKAIQGKSPAHGLLQSVQDSFKTQYNLSYLIRSVFKDVLDFCLSFKVTILGKFRMMPQLHK